MVFAEYVNFVLSFVTTFFLIPVIIFKSSKQMGKYKYFLLILAISDLHFSVAHLIVKPQEGCDKLFPKPVSVKVALPLLKFKKKPAFLFVLLPCMLVAVVGSYKDAFLFFDDGYLASHISICYFASSHSQALVLLCYHFVYRYSVTDRPAVFNKCRTCTRAMLLIVLSSLEFAIWFLSCYFLYGFDDDLQEYVREMLEDEQYYRKADVVVGTRYWNNNDELNVRGALGLLVFNVVMMICASIIAYCSVRIIRVLFGQTTHSSIKTVRLQRQLFIILVLQLFFPAFLIYLPCAVVITAPFLRLHLPFSPGIVAFVFTIFPFADAVVILFGISDYRNFVFRLVGLKKRNAVAAIGNVSQFTTAAPSRLNTVSGTFDRSGTNTDQDVCHNTVRCPPDRRCRRTAPYARYRVNPA